ncbi:MAG: pilus assembly protein TadG-related protein [Acidobacteria bacterium]|nr:pilus assembly protein TadG-related protein [Acidobacteriota bacterium]
MRHKAKINNRGGRENGATLLIVAAAMVVLLGISALAIDLVRAYLARVQCQRAADASALAGATVFVSQGCTSALGGCVQGGPQEAPATTQAVAVAGHNLVAGLAPTASTVSTSFSYPNAEEPQITVAVYRDKAHGDELHTFFAKILGVDYVDVSASATAEAYNPSGGNTSIGANVKPFLVPNCDPNHPVASTDPEHNPDCACGTGGVSNGDCPAGTPTTDYMSYYVDPTSGDIVNPGPCVLDATTGGCAAGSGVMGAPWTLHDNGGSPSQWYTIAFTNQSGQSYKEAIMQTVPQTVACNATLNSLNGQKVGPTDQGIDTLIHAANDGLNQGQDYMCSPTWPSSSGGYCATSPFQILGGANNPYNLAGQTFYGGPSDSIVSVVIFGCPSGQTCYSTLAGSSQNLTLTPGGTQIIVQGYMQLFIQDVTSVTGGKECPGGGSCDSIDTVVMNIGGCGAGTQGSGSSPPPATSTGGSFIPIRLIHQ